MSTVAQLPTFAETAEAIPAYELGLLHAIAARPCAPGDYTLGWNDRQQYILGYKFGIGDKRPVAHVNSPALEKLLNEELERMGYVAYYERGPKPTTDAGLRGWEEAKGESAYFRCMMAEQAA